MNRHKNPGGGPGIKVYPTRVGMNRQANEPYEGVAEVYPTRVGMNRGWETDKFLAGEYTPREWG